jgi:uncharacterized membrane protein
MTYLILGLVLFLGVHSVRIVAEDWRTATRARLGENAFKGAYSVLSLLGLVLLIWGYGQARQEPVLLWLPPVWTRHVAALLTIPAFVLLVASQVPGNHIRARLRHPMVLGIKLWAFAHLLSNGMLADVVLFGSFLLWAALSFRAARGRDRASGAVPAPGRLGPTLVVVFGGLIAWVVFAMWAHRVLIGVRPFG